MKVLIIGAGGREHAIGWKLAKSPKVSSLYFSPGNGGTSSLGTNVILDNSNHQAVVGWVKENDIDFVVIGPDDNLAEGLADSLLKEKIKTFGPTRKAAELEWSKSFAKKFMAEEGIPTSVSSVFSDPKKALLYIEKQKFPIVIKADGLALGKGVIMANNISEATDAIKQTMEEKVFGKAGEKIVIEEHLEGKEISIHAFCDGETAILFPSSQDHKRIFEDDKGDNTGGIGTIAPVPWVREELLKEIMKKIVMPVVNGMKKRGRPFKGILYPGIMVTSEGPKVIEFNVRFGDPETESYMRLLKSDLLDVLLACADGTLDSTKIQWEHKSVASIALASKGYPGKYKKGLEIRGIENIKDEDIVVFHAGTQRSGDKLLTSGGRVMHVTAAGNDLKEALKKAYDAIALIEFEGMYFRKDIGKKSLR